MTEDRTVAVLYVTGLVLFVLSDFTNANYLETFGKVSITLSAIFFATGMMIRSGLWKTRT